MSRPDLLPHVRDQLLRQAHGRQLRTARRVHRPLVARDVWQGLRLVGRHLARISAYAVLLVAGAALTLATFWPAQLP